MILLDTHAWISLASAPEQLSAAAAKSVRAADRLAVTAISCWEVAMLCDKGRIVLNAPPRDWMDQSLAALKIDLLELTTEIAVRAYQLGRDFHGDPADRLIVATALVHSAQLVTKDSSIQNCSAAPAWVW
jgi:PIN domain nuclease of toxin-antitoxin system